MVDEHEDWHYGGRYYLLTVLSDVLRDGTTFELDDAAPAPGRGTVAEVFCSDVDGATTFQSFTDEPLPLDVVERFIGEARRLDSRMTAAELDV